MATEDTYRPAKRARTDADIETALSSGVPGMHPATHATPRPTRTSNHPSTHSPSTTRRPLRLMTTLPALAPRLTQPPAAHSSPTSAILGPRSGDRRLLMDALQPASREAAFAEAEAVCGPPPAGTESKVALQTQGDLDHQPGQHQHLDRQPRQLQHQNLPPAISQHTRSPSPADDEAGATPHPSLSKPKTKPRSKAKGKGKGTGQGRKPSPWAGLPIYENMDMAERQRRVEYNNDLSYRRMADLRERNNESARRSRQKKADLIASLTAENETLKRELLQAQTLLGALQASQPQFFGMPLDQAREEFTRLNPRLGGDPEQERNRAEALERDCARLLHERNSLVAERDGLLAERAASLAGGGVPEAAGPIEFADVNLDSVLYNLEPVQTLSSAHDMGI